MSEQGISRRGLFRMIGGREAAPKAASLPESPLPRPPWSRDNRAFLALCDKCQQCVEACPERVLRPLQSDDDILNNTPVANLDYGQCTFCEECVKACPRGALNLSSGSKVQATAQITGQCVRLVGMPCDMCADSCPEQALIIDSRNQPQLISERCTGCGACSLACYSHAIEIIKLTRD